MKNPLKNLSEKQFRTAVLSILGIFLGISIIMCSFLYVNSLRTIHQAELIDKTAAEVTCIAETLKSTNGNLVVTSKMLRGHTSYKKIGTTLTFYYDEHLEPVSEPASLYSISINKEVFDDYYSYLIRVVRKSDKTEIYKLAFKDVRERK